VHKHPGACGYLHRIVDNETRCLVSPQLSAPDVRNVARICDVLGGIAGGVHPSFVASHGRVADRPPCPAETREAGASNTGQ
jgi:hypothetical protein